MISKENIQQAVETLTQGGVIAYPTETVYGLGADIRQGSAIEKILVLKGRPSSAALIILIPNASFLTELAEEITPLTQQLINCFWPGPLTLLFKALPSVSPIITGGSGKVGVRVSPDPDCMALMHAWNRPLISTSANPSGQPPATRVSEIHAYFNSSLDCILDGGPRNFSEPSSVLDCSGPAPILIREGAIPKSELMTYAGNIDD